METPEELQAAALAEPAPLFPRPEKTAFDEAHDQLHAEERLRITQLEVVLAQCAKRLAARLKTQADVQALARADALLGVRR